jgi:hypothetical protein
LVSEMPGFAIDRFGRLHVTQGHVGRNPKNAQPHGVSAAQQKNS